MKKRLLLVVLIIAAWMAYLAFQKNRIDALTADNPTVQPAQ